MKCKYANLDIVEVKTPEQLKIVQDLLASEPDDIEPQSIQLPKFNSAFWESDDNND